MIEKDKQPSHDLYARDLPNPSYAKSRQEREALYVERMKMIQMQDEPILADLRKIGIDIETLGHLPVKYDEKYKQAKPILLKHMLIPIYSERMRQTLAGKLAVKENTDLWPVLFEQYIEASNTVSGGYCYKYGLAEALAKIVTRATFDDLIALVKDAKHSESRAFLLQPLFRSRLDKAKQTIDELKNDPDLKKDIAASHRSKSN